MKKYTFEIYRDKKKEYRWRLKASNRKVVADCAEGYKRKAQILKFITDLQYDRLTFLSIDLTRPSASFNTSFVMRDHYKEK